MNGPDRDSDDDGRGGEISLSRQLASMLAVAASLGRPRPPRRVLGPGANDDGGAWRDVAACDTSRRREQKPASQPSQTADLSSPAEAAPGRLAIYISSARRRVMEIIYLSTRLREETPPRAAPDERQGREDIGSPLLRPESRGTPNALRLWATVCWGAWCAPDAQGHRAGGCAVAPSSCCCVLVMPAGLGEISRLFGSKGPRTNGRTWDRKGAKMHVPIGCHHPWVLHASHAFFLPSSRLVPANPR
jgi:hypothetical protein